MHRFFRWTPEAVYGTYDAANTAIYLPMDVPNSFKPLTTRPQWSIRDGTGLNVPRLRGSEVYSVAGKLSTRVYWDAINLVNWFSRVNSGQTLPWPTDQRPYDLASATVDFGWSYYDLTEKRMRYLGCKPGPSVTFNCAAGADNPFLTVDADVVGSKPVPNNYTADAALTSSTFPEPTQAQLPANPVTFQEVAFTVNGTTYNFFDKFTITIASMVKPYFDNSRFANRVTCNGRTVTLSAHLRLEASNDPRTTYEAMQALGECSLVFTKPGSGSHSLTFDFRSQSYLDSIDEDMVLDEDSYTTLSATAHLDATGSGGSPGDDFAITVV